MKELEDNDIDSVNNNVGKDIFIWYLHNWFYFNSDINVAF